MIKPRIQIGLAVVAMATFIPMPACPQASESAVEVTSSVAENSVDNTLRSSDENNTNSGFSKNSDFQTLPNVATNFEVEIQSRFNEIRSELLNEQALFIDRWLNVITIILTFLGVVVAVATFVGFSRFRAIENKANASVKIAAAAEEDAKHHLQEIQKLSEKAVAKLSDLDASFAAANPKEVTQTVANVRDNPDASLVEKAIADAVSLQQQGKHEDAIEKWSAIAQISEKSDNALAARAWLSIGYLSPVENVNEKISYYDRAIQLKPDLAVAYFNRGNAKRRLGQREDAIADFDKAIHHKPDFAEAYSHRGNVKRRLGRHEDAITDYDKAIQLNPDFAEAYANRGISKSSLERHEDAITDYDKAIQLNPDFAEAYSNRGTSKSDLERHEDAITDYDKAIQLDPDMTEAYANRGNLKYKLGFKVEAKADLETALRLAQNSDNVDFINLIEQNLNSLSATNGN